MANESKTPKGPPSYIDKVNSVIEFWEDPCGAPLTFYARTALPVAGEAFMSIIGFDMADVVRSMARPKPTDASRSYRHGRRGRKGGKGGKSLLAIGENIGKDLKASGWLPSQSNSSKLDFLWQVDNQGQKALFFLLVFGVTVDGLYRWSTLIQQSKFCEDEFGGALRYAREDQGLLGLLGWHAVTMGTPDPQPEPTGWNGDSATFRCFFNDYTCLWWGTFSNLGSIPIVAQLGFWHRNAVTEDPDIVTDPVVVPPFGFSHYFLKADFSKDYPAIFAGRTMGGNVDMLNNFCVVNTPNYKPQVVT